MLVFLAAVLLSHPRAEMGICDDWSYVRTAQLLAQTGHLQYNGYATAMIGWQLYVAAAFVKGFGFSFSIVRASSLIVGAVTAFLLERTLVRAGVQQKNAVIGTLAFVLSPLYMPLAASFMSDVQGLLALVLCIYSCLRTLQSRSEKGALAWIVFAIASNLVLGSSRQIAWLGILVIVPSTLWLVRRARLVLWAGSVATLVGAALIGVALHWFQRQPYSIPEHLLPNIDGVSRLAYMASQLSRAVLEIPFLLLPLSIAFLPEVRRQSRAVLCLMAACLLGYFTLAIILTKHHGPGSMLEPVLGDWVGPHAYYEGLLLNGSGPVVLTIWVRVILTLLSLAGLLCILAAVVRVRSSTQPRVMRQSAQLSWSTLAVLLVPFSAAYLLLLVPRSASVLVDRYLLALLFVAVLLGSRFYQDFVRPSLPASTILAVALVGVYGIAETHDMFAFYRARVAVVDQLVRARVPQNQIDGGLEYNGWVELQQSSHINDNRIANPAGAYQPGIGSIGFDCQGRRSASNELPHFAPKYGLSFDPGSCMGFGPVAPVSYFRWLGLRSTSLYAVSYEPRHRGAAQLTTQ